MEKQVKSKRRVTDFGEVYTAEREVKAMCDLIPSEIWGNIDSTFLEPSCGNGNFIIEILARKLSRCKNEAEVIRAYNSIWGIDILPDNCEETKKRMLDMCPEYADKSRMPLNIICGDSLEIMEQMKEGAVMGDMMSFPNTFEEFAEMYKIVDKEQIYTNGSELIPIFRVKQWLYGRPTADVAEVRHGEWVIKSETTQTLDDVDEVLYVECPFCQRAFYVPFEFEDKKILEYARKHYPYCHCGAKMDGKVTE